ncbi:winged helix-turn-helix transcriptional regulator [Humidisolicoccus flavus]|uniref:winged helix-turn-helix transcriptional regulator n=1 Tax=Humidisolicoccus flavus TaxID=3111414 RepID=UPI00324438ED
MAHVLILTRREGDVLPSLAFLDHRVTFARPEPSAIVHAPMVDITIIDATLDLANAKSMCKLLHSSGNEAPLVLAVTEGGLAAVNNDWGIDDVILNSAGPAEIDARLRLVSGKSKSDRAPIVAAGLTIDESSYQAAVNGKPLDLTYKEFELLRFLASHPVRVFTREQLLSEVWGYDYFGGTRTVDVHVRRLRAKLGDLDTIIGTVRNVGYRFQLVESHEQGVDGHDAP